MNTRSPPTVAPTPATRRVPRVAAPPSPGQRAPLCVTLLFATLAALTGCGQEPLVFTIQHIPVGYDGAEVLDADALDLEGDGDADILVSTVETFRFLEHADGRYTDATAGTALGKVAPAHAMHRAGNDDNYILQRDDILVRLESSGIGSWHEADGVVEDEGFTPEPMLEVTADLDGDGARDRARLVDRGVVIELARGDTWLDVTELVGLDALALPAKGRRIRAADLDGDGDMDLLLVGGRLYALVNNGGELAQP